MPIYEYQCASCGYEHAITQSIREPAIDLCPHCQGPWVRLISQSSFRLKGTGWYQKGTV